MVCCKNCKRFEILSQKHRIGICTLDDWTFSLDDYTLDESPCDFYEQMDSDDTEE